MYFTRDLYFCKFLLWHSVPRLRWRFSFVVSFRRLLPFTIHKYNTFRVRLTFNWRWQRKIRVVNELSNVRRGRNGIRFLRPSRPLFICLVFHCVVPAVLIAGRAAQSSAHLCSRCYPSSRNPYCSARFLEYALCPERLDKGVLINGNEINGEESAVLAASRDSFPLPLSLSLSLGFTVDKTFRRETMRFKRHWQRKNLFRRYDDRHWGDAVPLNSSLPRNVCAIFRGEWKRFCISRFRRKNSPPTDV